MEPSNGPWGTLVTITGTNLSANDATLVLGAKGEMELVYSDKGVGGWTPTYIKFRFPFPMEGAISIETKKGDAFVGEFTPSWIPGPTADLGGAGVLTSFSARPGHIALALDTTPPKLLEIEAAGVTERSIEVADANWTTLRLYNAAGQMHGFVLSNAAAPEILHLAPDGEGLKEMATGITTSGEVAIAGGPDGAVVWFRQGDDWTRARHIQGGWSIDKGPIADPNPSGKLHAAGATSDGSLFIAEAQWTGNFLDDTEAPFMRHLAADAAAFSSSTQVGNSLDDHLTVLRLEGRGSGLVIDYCGTESGISGTHTYCRSSARGGNGEFRYWHRPEDDTSRWAFTATLPTLAYCDEKTNEGIAFSSNPPEDLGEVAIWPCFPLQAFEVDAEGNMLPIVQKDGVSYSPRKRDDGAGTGEGM
jgi:hypothetical protein